MSNTKWGRLTSDKIHVFWDLIGLGLVIFINIEKNEMGGACSVYGGEERRIQGFGGETWEKDTIWETQD
jgi:hypothetical protein